MQILKTTRRSFSKSAFFTSFVPIFMVLSVTACLFQTGCYQQKSSSNSITYKTAPAPVKAKKTDVQEKTSAKIAMLLPLSGNQGQLGESLQHAAELSLFEHADADLEIAFYDTTGTPEGAQAAAERAIQEGAGLMVGPLFSSSVQAVSNTADAARLSMISFSNNQDIARPGVYTFGFSPREQIEEILKFAASQGHRVVAVIIPRSPYGVMVEGTIHNFKNQSVAQGMTFEIISYSGDSTALTKELNPLRTLNPDAIFIPEGGTILSRIVSSLLYQEIPLESVQFLGTGQWDEERTLSNRTLEGAVIAAPDPKRRIAFEAKYQATFGQKPIRISTLSYDVVSMLSVLRKHYIDNPFSSHKLRQARGFEGVDGVFRLTPNGTTERKLALSKITPQGLRVLRFADTQF